MPPNHNDNITINITLDPAPTQEAGFGTVLLIVPLATNSLDGDRVRTYTSVDGADADLAAAYISASTYDAIVAALSQSPAPAEFKVGYVDLLAGTPETYATALAACKLSDPDFYGVCIAARTAAEILAVANVVEADDKVFVFQSADSSWLDASVPAALSAIDGYENTAGIYHDDATEWADVAWLTSWLVFDPDTISAPADRGVAAVAAYTTAPTDTQKGHLDDNHMNHGLPYGGATFFVDAGVNMAGRPLYEILTAHWFQARLESAVAAEKVAHSARGEKITLDIVGQTKILSLLQKQLAIGVSAGHFIAEQTDAWAEDLTSADLDAQRMRLGAEAQIAVSARKFVFNVNFGRDPISE